MKSVKTPRRIQTLLALLAISAHCLPHVCAQSAYESNVPMTRPGEMLAVHQTAYGHASTFVELRDGRILHVAGKNAMISADGGLTWSEPQVMEDTGDNIVGGGSPSLVRLSGEGIGLAAWAAAPKEQDKATWYKWEGHILFWRSEDEGKTWAPPVRINPPNAPTYCLQDVLVRTSSGRILLPAYIAMGQNTGPQGQEPPAHGKLVRGQWVPTGAHYFDPRFLATIVYYSDDDGRTWQHNKDGHLFAMTHWTTVHAHTCEPTLAEVAPGQLLLLMRTALGRLYQSWSHDNGETWTRPLASPLAASTAPAQLRRLSNGHLLVVWNQESPEEVKKGCARTRLSAAISRNGGTVWEFFQNVESLSESVRVEPGPIEPVRPAEIHVDSALPAPVREPEAIVEAEGHGRWSYPSVLVLKDRVLIAHTYSVYEDDPANACLINSGNKPGGFNQKLKVLPLTWFYGGKQPADNPFFKNAHAPAKP